MLIFQGSVNVIILRDLMNSMVLILKLKCSDFRLRHTNILFQKIIQEGMLRYLELLESVSQNEIKYRSLI